MKVSRSLSITMIQFDIVNGLVAALSVHVELTVMRFDDRAVEGSKYGDTDSLSSEAFYLGINAEMTIIAVVAAIVGPNPGTGIDIDKVVGPQIAKEISALRIKRIFLR